MGSRAAAHDPRRRKSDLRTETAEWTSEFGRGLRKGASLCPVDLELGKVVRLRLIWAWTTRATPVEGNRKIKDLNVEAIFHWHNLKPNSLVWNSSLLLAFQFFFSSSSLVGFSFSWIERPCLMRHDDPLICGSQKTSHAWVVLGRFGSGSGCLLRVSDLNLLFKMIYPSGTIPPPLSISSCCPVIMPTITLYAWCLPGTFIISFVEFSNNCRS